MSSFEAKFRLSLANVSIGVPTEDALGQGIEPKVELTLGLTLPINALRNAQTGEPMQIPLADGVLDLQKEEALQFAEAITQAAEQLPDTKKGDVLIANNLSQVEQMAAEMDRVTKGGIVPSS